MFGVVAVQCLGYAAKIFLD